MGVSFALTMVFWKSLLLASARRKRIRQGWGTETASDVEISRKIEIQVIEQSREIITELYVPMKGQVLDGTVRR